MAAFRCVPGGIMKKGLIIISLIVLIVLGGIAWYLFEARQAQDSPPPAVSEIAPQTVPVPEPEPEMPTFEIEQKKTPAAPELDELPLPPLHESDGYVHETLSGVVGEAATMQYFPGEALVAKAVATIDALGSRQVPGNIRAALDLGGEFTAVPDSNPPSMILDEEGDPEPQFLSNPANQGRYVGWVELLEAVDAEQFAALYRANYPLFQQAWNDLGYAGHDFNERLLEIIDELLATPVVSEPYRLIKPEAVYLFSDEELESLSAGQKILLRMGSGNAARVKSRLAEIRQAID
jgi:hypothetical protein